MTPLLRRWLPWLLCAATLAAQPVAAHAQATPSRLQLGAGWTLQDSAQVAAKGDALSKPGASVAGWHQITVEYQNPTGVAYAKLAWAGPGFERVTIPADHLRPAA